MHISEYSGIYKLPMNCNAVYVELNFLWFNWRKKSRCQEEQEKKLASELEMK